MTKIDIRHDSLRDGIKSRNRKQREFRLRLVNATPDVVARNDRLPFLAIEMLDLDAVPPPKKRRLRKSDAAHIREVANSIQALGFCVPVLIGQDNVVLDGFSRLDAARLLALPAIPCIRIGHLTETEQRLLRLAVNRLGEKVMWDLPELQAEFEELIIASAPIELSGFTPDEIDQIVIGDADTGLEEGDLSPAPGSAISQIGDVFRLGEHRLICGDATDSGVVAKLMGETMARFILTDEPFNVPISGHVTSGDRREFVMASGEMTPAEFLAFNQNWMGAALPYLVDGGVLATFIDWRGWPVVHAVAVEAGLLPLNLIVWSKTNAGLGSLYRSQHELVPLFKKGEAPHVNNIALGKRGRHRSNIWIYPGASSLGSAARRGLQDHPTVKPTAMLQDALIDLSNRDDVILDPFAGSGSTLIACEKTGRICHSIELDPLYVDVIVRRFETVSRKPAVLDETGETFAQAEQRRSAATEA